MVTMMNCVLERFFFVCLCKVMAVLGTHYGSRQQMLSPVQEGLRDFGATHQMHREWATGEGRAVGRAKERTKGRMSEAQHVGDQVTKGVSTTSSHTPCGQAWHWWWAGPLTAASGRGDREGVERRIRWW